MISAGAGRDEPPVGEPADEGPGRDVRAETGPDGQGGGGQRGQRVGRSMSSAIRRYPAPPVLASTPQHPAASRAGQLAGGQVRFGPRQVHYPDHRFVVSPQRTSVVYHAPRWRTSVDLTLYQSATGKDQRGCSLAPGEAVSAESFDEHEVNLVAADAVADQSAVLAWGAALELEPVQLEAVE